MVTSSEDGTVKIWDTRTGSVQRDYRHGAPVNDVVIHPNQGELISCDRGGEVRVWDLGENRCSHQLIPEDDVSVASVTVASDGSMLCAGNNSVCTFQFRLLFFLINILNVFRTRLTIRIRVPSSSGACSKKAISPPSFPFANSPPTIPTSHASFSLLTFENLQLAPPTIRLASGQPSSRHLAGHPTH